ncbi:PAS domain S-box protein [Thalassobellus suaedae]|uniref:histidine kinase n=1 Tax=Thalassobellus suaedae TaxID=3074124 RepID=A0ABY9Y2I2_9FLAO|nr:PAS domain-containing sensor histidine kinase [Flavobacteriaceae bacterium HL-DH10]
MNNIADYKYALDQSSILAITDQKGIIIHVNDNFCKISKYSVKELIGQDHRIINSGYHTKAFIKNLWSTIANGEVWKGELKNKAKDGTTYWVDTTIVPFLNADNKPYQYVAIRSDITDRKNGEEEIKKTLKEISDYKYALDQSSILAITDQKGVITHVNENFCKISKYSVKELIGQDHRIINSGYHSKAFIKELWTTIANGEVWKGELKNKAKDGTTYWVDTTIVPFLNADNKPYQYVAIRSDITDRKNGEEEIKKTLKEISDYKYALDQSSILAITDQKGIITHVNENFCKISKYSLNELIGQDHRIINSGYHSKEFIKELWVTIANGKVWKGELKNRAKDGSAYWVDTTIVPFLNADNKPYQYVAIRSDITDRKKGEEEIKRNHAKAIEHTKILEFKNEQLIDFCNIVSHNLRAPLINISMLVDYIEISQDDEERKEMLSKIKPVVNHLMDVFNELVESIQVTYDTEIQVDKIDLKTCLHKILRGFETQIQEYDADIQFDLNQASTIYFPEKYIESILTNLISNALKYKSPIRKPVIIIKTIKAENNKVILSVTDNGLGIDLVLHKDKIFKIRKTFHKHPDAKGFGLFITKTHMEAMNGKIWAESQPDKGSTFFIEFKNQKA